jgi:hypothetical protein
MLVLASHADMLSSLCHCLCHWFVISIVWIVVTKCAPVGIRSETSICTGPGSQVIAAAAAGHIAPFQASGSRVWRLPVRFSFAADKPEESRKPSAPAPLCERQVRLRRISAST